MKSANTESATLRKVIREYANAVSKHGVGSAQANAVRKKHADDQEFLAYADALDRLKAALSGSRRGSRSGAKRKAS